MNKVSFSITTTRFLFYKNTSKASREDPDQTAQEQTDQGAHCLPFQFVQLHVSGKSFTCICVE